MYESNKIKIPRTLSGLKKTRNGAVGIVYKIRSDCTQKVLLSLYFPFPPIIGLISLGK